MSCSRLTISTACRPISRRARAAMRATGAEVVKLAVKASGSATASRCCELGAQHGADRTGCADRHGRAGAVTRVLPARFGSPWTYAGLRHGSRTARRRTTLLDEYRFRSHRPATDVYGVVGSPVSHSVSPAMHNAAFARAGHRRRLPAAARRRTPTTSSPSRAPSMCKGASVTIPYKVALLDRVRRRRRRGRAARSAPSTRFASTTGDGWAAQHATSTAFCSRCAIAASRCAARARRCSARAGRRAPWRSRCRRAAPRSRVHARNAQRAAEVAALASARRSGRCRRRGQLGPAVNCTPVGMYPRRRRVADAGGSCLAPGLVYDLVYNPAARGCCARPPRAGCETIGGLEMLVGQAPSSSTGGPACGRRPA